MIHHIWYTGSQVQGNLEIGLHGKLIAAIEFKAGRDVFYNLLKNNPQDFSTIIPEKVQGCDLHEGEFGRVGSIICWRYTHDGKQKKAKEVIQSIDEEKKLIELKIIEGDMMELYKAFVVAVHVETTGDIDLLTWTLKYEMLNEDVEHPISFLSYVIDITKEVEAHHLAKP
ncbi:kirola-like [Salvia miltiorrhiza]|uniref:kirola-like n=1 Tax=Salvia miltiorrhiza TaxID=226208 RepID=UPI0025ACEA96|nr:kirola-like [Salvia miltiorrhiza]